MPKMLVMPSEEDLPAGPKRAFVAELFVHYREANRPPLREIAQWIKDHAETNDLRGTASTETIRRVMTGAVVPSKWFTVEVILEALCAIAGRSTDEDRWEDSFSYGNEPVPTFKVELRRRWDAAFDQETGEGELPRLPPRPAPAAPVPTPAPRGSDDPWAVRPTTGFGASSEDPPF